MVKRKSDDDCESGEVTTVKCTLERRCLLRELYEQIQRDVLDISRLSIEASIYIHYSLMRDWSNGIFATTLDFTKYFYALRETPPKPKAKRSKAKIGQPLDLDEYQIDAVYKGLRNGIPFPDARYKFNQIQHAITKYTTLFHNNLWMHAYTRVRRYLYHKIKADASSITRKTVYEFLQKLFIKTKSDISELSEDEAQLLLWLKQDLDYDDLGFYDLRIKNKYAKYLRFFYNLQRYNETHELPNFALIPILRHGRHHTTIDTKALSDILARLKSKFNRWSDYFKFEDLERGKKFRGSISTDGVAVSFSMEHAKRKITKTKKSKTDDEVLGGNLTNIQASMNQYTQFIGLDPGLRLICGGIAKTREELVTRNGRKIKLRSSHFRHLTGESVRKQKLESWTREIEAESLSTISPMSSNYLEYTMHRLRFFEAKQRVYEARKVTRLKFDKYRRTEQAAHKLAEKIIGKDEAKTLIIIGSSKIASNSPIRGYVRTPQPKVLAALKRRADVLEINEFSTTKLCCNCHETAITSTSPHRYQFCPKCGKLKGNKKSFYLLSIFFYFF